MADLRELVNRILDNDLDGVLRRLRAAGDSYDDIARWLHTTRDITVSRETIRRWCAIADGDEPDAAA